MTTKHISSDAAVSTRPHGVMASFSSARDLFHAAEAIRDAGYKKFDTFSPFPIHGMDRAMGISDSPLGFIVLVGGILGLIGGFSLQAWANSVAYAFIISGKPFLSGPAFIPVTFEVTILLSAFSTVFGMFHLNRLPTFYHPTFNYSHFKRVTTDGFFVCIESDDAQFDEAKVMAFLKKIGGSDIELVQE